MNETWKRRRWPLGIGAFALALRLVLFTGLQGNDDLIYSKTAYALATHTFSPGAGVFEMRLGYVAPVGLLYALFGVHVACLLAVPLASSLLLVVLAYRFGRELYSEETGRIAALFVALLPMDVFHATESHSDLPQAALATSGLYLLWMSLRFPRESPAGRRGALGRALAAGLLFGGAHLTKESSFVLLAAAIPWIRSRKNWPLLIAAGGALAAVVASESAVYGFITGDPLRRVHAAVACQEGHLGPAARPGSGLWGRILESASLFFNPSDPRFPFTGGLLALAAAGLVWAVWRDRLHSGMIAFWWGVSTLLLCLWPLSLFPYRPVMLLHPRVLAPIVVPGSLLAARLVAGFLRPAWPKATSMGMTLAGLFALVCAMRIHGDAVHRRAGPEWAFEKLSHFPGATVIADPRGGETLRLMGRYSLPYSVRTYGTADPPPPPGTLLLDDDEWVSMNRDWDGLEPPSWWRSVAPPRGIVDETVIPGPFRLLGKRRAGDRVVLSRVIPGP